MLRMYTFRDVIDILTLANLNNPALASKRTGINEKTMYKYFTKARQDSNGQYVRGPNQQACKAIVKIEEDLLGQAQQALEGMSDTQRLRVYQSLDLSPQGRLPSVQFFEAVCQEMTK